VCPYGYPSDRLWVRETWARSNDARSTKFTDDVLYAADFSSRWRGDAHFDGRWRPSIHMPRWASRITLEITEVRVQRLQGISEEDAFAEGVAANPYHMADGTIDEGMSISARANFASLWDSINGSRAPWSENPWVWAITFKRVEAP
jgi:hypothetical protein